MSWGNPRFKGYRRDKYAEDLAIAESIADGEELTEEVEPEALKKEVPKEISVESKPEPSVE